MSGGEAIAPAARWTLKGHKTQKRKVGQHEYSVVQLNTTSRTAKTCTLLLRENVCFACNFTVRVWLLWPLRYVMRIGLRLLITLTRPLDLY